MTTGSPNTGCAWTPRARKSSRPSSARCPRPDPPRPAPTCAPATNAAARPLVEICRRAAAAGGAAPVTTKAAVFITVSLQDLQARCAAGSTLTSSTGSTAEPPACSTAPCSAGDTTPSPTKRAGPQQPPPAKSPGTFDHPAPQPAATGGHCCTPATQFTTGIGWPLMFACCGGLSAVSRSAQSFSFGKHRQADDYPPWIGPTEASFMRNIDRAH